MLSLHPQLAPLLVGTKFPEQLLQVSATLHCTQLAIAQLTQVDWPVGCVLPDGHEQLLLVTVRGAGQAQVKLACNWKLVAQVWQELVALHTVQNGTAVDEHWKQPPLLMVDPVGHVHVLLARVKPAGQLHCVLLLLATKLVPHVWQVFRLAHTVQPAMLHRGVHKLLVADN